MKDIFTIGETYPLISVNLFMLGTHNIMHDLVTIGGHIWHRMIYLELNFMNFYHVRSPLKLSAAGYKDPIKLLEPYMCIQHSVFTHGEINRIILD